MVVKRAEADYRDREWLSVVNQLRRIELKGLDDGTACHIRHLLGVGQFFLGKTDEAIQSWQEGTGYEQGRCELSELLEYGRIVNYSKTDRKKAAKEGTLPTTMRLIDEMDCHLENSDWMGVVSLVRQYNQREGSVDFR